MNYLEAMNFISSFSRLGKKVSDLSRIAKLLDKIENPQDKLKFVHIAGTNGKGSTLELTSNALINANYKTGQFTSPFMICYEDRIRINNINISKNKLAEMTEKIKNAITSKDYSQFEITFAIALLYYVEEKCDIILLETGVGGLLDATNIIKNPLVTVITSISYDHEDILGNTIQKITRQKGGIIKNNIPNILSMGNYKESIEKITDICKDMNSELIIPNEKDLEIISQTICDNKFIYKNKKYKLKMNGYHQIQNACTVIECLNILNNKGFQISYENIKKSFETVQICGRTEIINNSPLVILDGAHNFDGFLALKNILKTLNSEIIAVIGMLKRKDYNIIVEEINEYPENISEIICVDGFLENNVPAQELAEMFTLIDSTAMNFKDAYIYAIEKAKKENKTVTIFGSLYLVTELKKYLTTE